MAFLFGIVFGFLFGMAFMIIARIYGWGEGEAKDAGPG